MPGKSEFPMQLNRRAVADIVDLSKQLRIEDLEFIRAATYEDVQAAYILLALEQYLEQRRIQPDFKVVLSE